MSNFFFDVPKKFYADIVPANTDPKSIALKVVINGHTFSVTRQWSGNSVTGFRAAGTVLPENIDQMKNFIDKANGFALPWDKYTVSMQAKANKLK